jgi:hypothetical protein
VPSPRARFALRPGWENPRDPCSGAGSLRRSVRPPKAGKRDAPSPPNAFNILSTRSPRDKNTREEEVRASPAFPRPRVPSDPPTTGRTSLPLSRFLRTRPVPRNKQNTQNTPELLEA